MSIKAGTFQCPKCGKKVLNLIKVAGEEKIFIESWEQRQSYINNDLKEEWIFCAKYHRIWKCFSLYLEIYEKCKACYPLFLTILLNPMGWLLAIALIILSGPIDLIYYIFCSKSYEMTTNFKSGNIDIEKKVKKSRLWTEINGFTERQWEYFNYSLKCSCGHNTKKFSDFINIYNNVISESSANVINDTGGIKIIEVISIYFSFPIKNIYYCIYCNINDKLSVIINKLYEIYPMINEKRIYFSLNGKNIDVNKSLSENNIKNGDIILMEEMLHIKLESMDQRIKCSFLCIKNDNFQVIEKK